MTGNGCLSPGSVDSPILDKSKEKYANIHINQTKKIKYKEKILKAAREKQQITCKETPIRITVNLSTKTLQARREWGKTYNQDYSTQQGSHSYSKEKSKAFRQGKAKRIQHHQTSSLTNAKGSYLDRKHRKRFIETNPKQNGNRKKLINNYLKHKWVKCSKQKTETGQMDTKARPLYMLPTKNPPQT